MVVVHFFGNHHASAQFLQFKNQEFPEDRHGLLKNNPYQLKYAELAMIKENGFSVEKYNWDDEQINRLLFRASYHKFNHFVPTLLMTGGAIAMMTPGFMQHSDVANSSSFVKGGAFAVLSGMAVMAIKQIISTRSITKAEQLRVLNGRGY